MFDVNAG
jgi:hypothetical protein